jgi:phosphoribosylaminoimidazole-succinocarboxamide synthase
MDILTIDLPGIPRMGRGKVREIYDLGEHLLLVATDRISAFDCILPDPIPRKGHILNRLSEFWFSKLDFVPNHLVTAEFGGYPPELQPFRELLEGRSMLVRKCSPLPVECVARGYLAGSGYEEYAREGTVGGHTVPPGLQNAARLPEALFTPARKAPTGHDENISWKQCRSLLGDEIASQVRDWTIDLYEHARAYAATRGIILADTKFEFGLLDGEVILIDECLTPDSSRFWAADSWKPGANPPSFDKQFVRDYLASLDWDRNPPAPHLPPEVIAATSARYREAYSLLTGRGH